MLLKKEVLGWLIAGQSIATLQTITKVLVMKMNIYILDTIRKDRDLAYLAIPVQENGKSSCLI